MSRKPSLKEGVVVVYSILGCPHCMEAKQKLTDMKISFTDVRFDLYPQVKVEVLKNSGMTTVPQIYFNSVLIGGKEAFLKLATQYGTELSKYIDEQEISDDPNGMPIIPDPSTAVSDPDPFGVTCEADESYLLVIEMKKDGLIKVHGSFFSKKMKAFSGNEFVVWVNKGRGLGDGKDGAGECNLALNMGQALLDRKLVKCEGKHSKFVGGPELYSLVESDWSEALNAGAPSECLPQPAVVIGDQLRKMILKLYSIYLSPDGKSVDYVGMKASSEFKQYKALTRELLRVNLEVASREEKLAFFINIYNALVIHANVDKGPPTSLWGRYKFFNNTKYIIGANTYSLQDIENGVLRANRKGVGQFSPPFGKDDPRLKVALEKNEPLVHFGLVCGAKSCPPIKTYTVKDIYDELKLAAASFFENDDGCEVDVTQKTIKLSSILKWYSVDFGKNKEEVVEFVIKHIGAGQKKSDLEKLAKGGDYKLTHIKYDWSVNSKS